MEYKTYWSLSDLPSNSIKSFEVFLYVAIFCLIVWFSVKWFKKENRDFEKKILLWSSGLIFIFSIIMFTYLKFSIIDSTEERIQKILNSNYVAKVEGEISNYSQEKPLSRRGRVTYVYFTVDSVDFSYEDALLGRFNNFTETNGILRDDLPVRITYEKATNKILKIEVEKSSIENYSH